MHRSTLDHSEWDPAVTVGGLGELRALSLPASVLAADRPLVADLQIDLSDIPAQNSVAHELLASGRAEALGLFLTILLGLAQGR